jgi:hypothetical protein
MKLSIISFSKESLKNEKLLTVVKCQEFDLHISSPYPDHRCQTSYMDSQPQEYSQCRSAINSNNKSTTYLTQQINPSA